MVALNRAIAVSMGSGPTEGLAALEPLEAPLAEYHLFYAARADMLGHAGKDRPISSERSRSSRTRARDGCSSGGYATTSRDDRVVPSLSRERGRSRKCQSGMVVAALQGWPGKAM